LGDFDKAEYVSSSYPIWDPLRTVDQWSPYAAYDLTQVYGCLDSW